MKKNVLIPIAGSQLNLEIIPLSEVSQNLKGKYHMSLTGSIYTCTSIHIFLPKKKEAWKE